MSNLFQQLKAFARTPQGRAMIEKARREAAKPENRQRLENLTKRTTPKR